MDSRTQLDYALFQLTPTRTRYDLVIFAAKKSEKIASGLLEPFLSHLKSAKDQISKGGYSITLKPKSSDASSWFTKATLDRFVRFVNTPEVLERFVTIEREINQIEGSIESNEQVNGTVEVQGTASSTDGDPTNPFAPSKTKIEPTDYDAEAEENPKIRLQRVLESRKAMLKKEQAMAYARALVAGFEMDYLYDLVSFGDSFGALRLREACLNFMELCNKKNDDKIWMDEVAVMQASYLGTSGIILAGENNDLYQTARAKSSASDSITRHGSLDTSEGTDNGLPVESSLQQPEGAAQTPTWAANHFPQYMQNTQGPMFQQIPSYPGYIFPGMQILPSHYPGNMPWPANFQDPSIYLDRDINDSKRSFNNKKENFSNHARRHSTKDEGDKIEQTSSGSDSSDKQDHEASLSPNERIHKKKHNKPSSRKFVIRNINYIASGRNEEGDSDSDSSSSDDDEYVDADSIKQQVEAAVPAVGSLKIQQKSASNKNKVRGGSKKAINKSMNGLNTENAGMTNSEEERKDGNWDIFQNLLLRDSDTNSKDMGSETIQVHQEYSIQKAYGEENSSSLNIPKYASDDFLLMERSTGNGIENTNVKFEGQEAFHGVKMRAKDELLMPSRIEGEYYTKNAHFGAESSIIRMQKEEDWIIGSRSEISANPVGSVDHNIFCGEQTPANHFQNGENKREVLLDDSFMVLSRLSDGPQQTQPRADMFMVSDIVGANQLENSMPGNSTRNFHEPEDLSMMLGHDFAAERTPEMDYTDDILLYETVKSGSNNGPSDSVDTKLLYNGNASNIRNSKEPGRNVTVKEPKSKAPTGSSIMTKSVIPSRSKLSAAGNTLIRGKANKEEEKRKRMEELLIHRQKRIAERSAAKGITPETSKRPSKESKNPVSRQTEKAKLQTPTDENKKSRKPIMRSSTIDRLAAARTTKQSSAESKVGQNQKPTSKVNLLGATSSLKKTNGTQKQEDKGNSADKKTNTNNSKASSWNTHKKDSITATPVALEECRSAEGTLRDNSIEDFGAVKVLHTVTSVEKREANMLSTKDASDDKNSIPFSSDKDLLSSEDLSAQKELQVNVDDHVGITPQTTAHPTVENILRSTVAKTDEKVSEKKKLSFSPEISVMDVSTPPPNSETSPELIHSRKKWNNGESSPRIPKGFRKLLLFGRRT